MISGKMESSLNEQIKNEVYSAYLYLAMSAYCDSADLSGFSHWFRLQFDEEMSHAMKIYDYILEQSGRVELLAIDQPPKDFGGPVKVFEETLAHEKTVTGMINNLMDIAVTEKDHATQIFLQWFVTEQIEEEANAESILKNLKMVGGQGNGLFMIDRELAQRIAATAADGA